MTSYNANDQWKAGIQFTIGQLKCTLACHWSFVLYDVVFIGQYTLFFKGSKFSKTFWLNSLFCCRPWLTWILATVTTQEWNCHVRLPTRPPCGHDHHAPSACRVWAAGALEAGVARHPWKEAFLLEWAYLAWKPR